MTLTLNQHPSRNRQRRALQKKLNAVNVREQVNVTGTTRVKPAFDIEMPHGIDMAAIRRLATNGSYR